MDGGDYSPRALKVSDTTERLHFQLMVTGGPAAVKNPPANAEDTGSGRAPGERNGNPLQYSRQRNPMDRGAYSPWGYKRVGHNSKVLPHCA